MGKLIAICVSEKKGTQKQPVSSAVLRADHGIEGDAHAGKWHRQVSLLGLEKIEAFRAKGAEVDFGAFGENLIIEGFDFRNLPVGTRFRIGGVKADPEKIGAKETGRAGGTACGPDSDLPAGAEAETRPAACGPDSDLPAGAEAETRPAACGPDSDLPAGAEAKTRLAACGPDSDLPAGAEAETRPAACGPDDGVLLEMTQIGKECHSHCAIFHLVGDCIMPREGVFARVLRGGVIHPGDEVTEIPPVPDRPFTAAWVTLSDKGAQGLREDRSGPLIGQMLAEDGYDIIEEVLIPDDRATIEKELTRLADQRQVNLIMTTGGTGFSPRDVTPEATEAVCDRMTPGISEAIRAYSMTKTPRAMLSRAASGIRGQTLIINLPGSPKAVRESLEFILPSLRHGLEILTGRSGECGQSV